MTISEFLTARLNVDEHWVRALRTRGEDSLADRALREVEAKRAIVGRHEPMSGFCCWCSTDTATPATLDMPWPCPDVLSVAGVYRDHPDYDAVVRQR